MRERKDDDSDGLFRGQAAISEGTPEAMILCGPWGSVQ